MKSQILFFGLFLIGLATEQIHGQGRFKPGYYVNNDNDTVHGYIAISAINNENEFSFKTTSKGKKFITLPFDSCRLISRDNELYFITTLNRSLEYLDKFSHEIMMQGHFLTEPIPLKLIYTGSRFALFRYDDNREHYFLFDGKVITELAISYGYPTDGNLMKLDLNVKSRYFINKDYQRQIIAAFNNELTSQQQALVFDTEYEEKPLIRLFKSLDKNSGKKEPLKINSTDFLNLNKH